MKRKVSFKTLGCRLNQYETDALVTSFDKAGYDIVDFEEEADVVVINTCTVTNQSDQKSRHSINHAASKNKNALVIVAGCMVDNYKDKLEAQDNIDYVVDNDHKSKIVDLVESHFHGELTTADSYGTDRFDFDTVRKSLHTRTSIKIQDGCDNFCSYCIIPSVRGAAMSRPLPDILDNVRRVVDYGFKEIVITGVNIGRYDLEGLSFEKVLEEVLDIPGDFRVRISSLEPDGFGPDFHKMFDHPKLAPHLHLCVQSGSEKVLRDMKRMYTAAHFMETMERFRKYKPDFNFTTDIIVGFPGESDRDFQDTLDFVRAARFSHIHTFRYSRRTGTQADKMKDQVNGKVMTVRSEEIRKLSEALRSEYLQSMLGKTQRMLIERVDENGSAKGYGEHYIPLQYKTKELTSNRFVDLKMDRIEGDSDLYIVSSLV